MHTYYVIRSGYNAANQPSHARIPCPVNDFESGYLKLVGVVDAASPEAAIDHVNPTCHNKQRVFATTNDYSIDGLRAAVRMLRLYSR